MLQVQKTKKQKKKGLLEIQLRLFLQTKVEAYEAKAQAGPPRTVLLVLAGHLWLGNGGGNIAAYFS